MDGFLGIDIGTTNSKALLLTEEGRILELWTQETPYKIIGGRQYMDIRRIEEFTDQWIDTAGKLCRLKSVSYSSIGESVIPVKDGKSMAFPLAWYEDVPMLVQDTKAYTGFEYTGVHDSNTFSFYKIMWMEKNILSEPPDYWLPVCSYFIYRKTGNACWDTSQAGRSYMYDIHNKAWIREVTERYGIQVPERIGLIGEGCGEKDGITYSLGGHDHYVGLFAVYQLSGGKELFYDSMGSSSVLAAVMDDSSRRSVRRSKATAQAQFRPGFAFIHAIYSVLCRPFYRRYRQQLLLCPSSFRAVCRTDRIYPVSGGDCISGYDICWCSVGRICSSQT